MTCDVSLWSSARKLGGLVLRASALLMMALLVLVVPGASILRAQSDTPPAPVMMRIGVLSTEGATRTLESWTATADLLNQAAAAQDQPYRFSIAPQTLGSLFDALDGGRVDLVLSDPASFVASEVENGARAILSATHMWDGVSHDLTGALVFTRADRPYRSLDQLGGTHVMAVAPGDFGGWWLAEQEFRKHRIEPREFLGEIVFSGGNQREVIYAVQSGLVDVGVVRAGALEALARQGVIDLADFAPISRRSIPDYPFWVSTPLFPEWVLSALPGVPKDALALIINTLLAVTPDSAASIAADGAVWQAPQNFQTVHDLLVSLRVRPYEDFFRQAVKRIFRAYRWPIIGAFAAIVLSLSFLAYQARRNMQLAEARRDVLKSEIRSKKFYRSAIEEHTVFCMLTLDGQISHVNKRFTETSERTRQSLLGQPLVSLLPEADQALLVAEIMSSMQVGAPWNGPLRLNKKDGSTAWVHCTFIPVTGTEDKLSEIALVATDMTSARGDISSEEFKNTLELIDEQVIVMAPGSLELIYCNRAAVERLARGRTVMEWKGKPLEGLMSKSNFEALVVRCNAVIEGPQRRVTWDVVTKKGIDYEISLEYVQPEDDAPRLVAIYRDVTQRKAADKAKKEFISTVSHELRTPLTSMKGALKLALSGLIGELPEKAGKMVSMASSNCDRLERLINDILDLEKIEAGKMKFNMQELDLKELVDAAIEANQFYAKKYDVNLICQTDDAEAGYITIGDQSRMMQVMDNLLSNASKFSPKNADIVASLSLHNGWIRLCVSDQGSGIPEAAQATIFDKFTQSDSSDTRSKGGTGLGLSIVKLIVGEHKGHIFCQSEEGAGTDFFVDMPRVEGNVITPVASRGPDGASRIAALEEGNGSREPALQAKNLLEHLQAWLQRGGANVELEAARGGADGIKNGNGRLSQPSARQGLSDDNRAMMAGLIGGGYLDNGPVSELRITSPESKGPGDVDGTSRSMEMVLDWLAELGGAVEDAGAGDKAALKILGVAAEPNRRRELLDAGLAVVGNIAQTLTALESQAFDVVLLCGRMQAGGMITILPIVDGGLAGRLPITALRVAAAAAKPGLGVVSKFARRSGAGKGQR